MKYPTIKELKKMLIHMDVSILDVPWEKLKQGQLLKILRWERARDKKAKPLPAAKPKRNFQYLGNNGDYAYDKPKRVVDRPKSCRGCDRGPDWNPDRSCLACRRFKGTRPDWYRPLTRARGRK